MKIILFTKAGKTVVRLVYNLFLSYSDFDLNFLKKEKSVVIRKNELIANFLIKSP